MHLPDIEAVIPGLGAARAGEHHARAMVFAGLTWTIMGCELVSLTPRHRLELQMAQNAFTRGIEASAIDVFQVLWRLNPNFCRKARPLSRPWFARRKIVKIIRANPTPRIARELSRFLAAMLQDMPERREAAPQPARESSARYLHWMGAELAFIMPRFPGITIESYLDTPYLVIQQLVRAWRVNNEDGVQFINASDALVNQWLRKQQRAANRN